MYDTDKTKHKRGRNDLKKKSTASLIVIASVIIVVVFAGCLEEETPVKSPETTLPAETATPVQKTPTELNLKVGETANTSKIAVTVISASKTDHYVYYSDILKETRTEQASPGHVFVLAEMEIQNIGSDRAYVGSTGFSMPDSEGFRYDPELLYYGNDGLEMLKELYQHQKMRGKVLFKVPEDAQELKIQYDFGNLFTEVKLASWELE